MQVTPDQQTSQCLIQQTRLEENNKILSSYVYGASSILRKLKLSMSKMSLLDMSHLFNKDELEIGDIVFLSQFLKDVNISMQVPGVTDIHSVMKKNWES